MGTFVHDVSLKTLCLKQLYKILLEKLTFKAY